MKHAIILHLCSLHNQTNVTGYRIQNILVYMTVHLFKMMPCITGILHTLHC